MSWGGGVGWCELFGGDRDGGLMDEVDAGARDFVRVVGGFGLGRCWKLVRLRGGI